MTRPQNTSMTELERSKDQTNVSRGKTLISCYGWCPATFSNTTVKVTKQLSHLGCRSVASKIWSHIKLMRMSTSLRPSGKCVNKEWAVRLHLYIMQLILQRIVPQQNLRLLRSLHLPNMLPKYSLIVQRRVMPWTVPFGGVISFQVYCVNVKSVVLFFSGRSKSVFRHYQKTVIAVLSC